MGKAGSRQSTHPNTGGGNGNGQGGNTGGNSSGPTQGVWVTDPDLQMYENHIQQHLGYELERMQITQRLLNDLKEVQKDREFELKLIAQRKDFQESLLSPASKPGSSHEVQKIQAKMALEHEAKVVSALTEVKELHQKTQKQQAQLQRDADRKMEALQQKILALRKSELAMQLSDRLLKPVFAKHYPAGQPQPDERMTQAEYEKVVKGARLTDPVEEPISIPNMSVIYSMQILPDDKLLFSYEAGIFISDLKTHSLHQLSRLR